MKARYLLLCFLFIGCEDEVVRSPGLGSAVPEVSEKPPPSAKKDDVPPPMDFDEAEFAESERSRDPFRSFIDVFVEEARGEVKSQREVVLEQFSIDELRLIGIVTRLQPARAMLVDPRGIGHVVRRGQFVGRPEVVQTAKNVGATYETNWRIEGIRSTDIVLVREDPTNPDVPSATRVMPLRPEGEVELIEEGTAAGS